MRYDERDDGELLELAASGWAPAFAVLVHRHAPALLVAFADDPDPAERVTDVFLRAMRELPDRAPAGSVSTWLFALAGRPAPEQVPAVPEETLDPIWRELSIRWPDGRHVHRGRPLARRLAVIGGALAVGVLVPLVVLGLPAAPDGDAIESVRAEPLEDAPTEEREPEDIPSFEFPDVTAGAEEAPTDAPDDEPPAPVAPPTTDTATPVAPEPEPEATEDPVPEPVDPVEPIEPVEPPPTGDDGTADGTADGGADSDGSADGSGDGSGDGGSDGSGDGSDGGDGGATLPVIGGDA
jgi:uncharacterized membrane protein YgcG